MPPKAAKKAEPQGGKAAPGKKKKWSKRKVRDKLNNMVLFDQATYGKLYKELQLVWQLVLNWSVWEKDDVDEATSLVLRGDKHDQKSLIRKRMRHGRAFTDEHHGRVEQLMETVMARLGAGGHPRYTPKSCRQGYISSYIAELCRRRNETDLLSKNEILDRIQSTGVWDDRRVAEIYMNELVKSYSRDQGAGTCPQTVRGWQECVFRRSFRAKWLRAMQVDKQTLEARMDSQAGRRQQKEDDYWDKTAPISFDPSRHL